MRVTLDPRAVSRLTVAQAGRAAVLAALALAAFALPACHHATLGKPAFVGASATAGVGAATSADPEGALPVDLAVAYDAVVEVGHDDCRRCADGLFYQRPDEAAREQAAMFAEGDASVVFAVDWLFWAAYAPVSDRAPAVGAPREGPVLAHEGAMLSVDDGLALRLGRVDAALAELAVFDAAQTPIILGDLPDFAGDPTTDRPVAELAPSEVAALNERVAAWAAARPWVVLLPVSSFAAGPRTLPDGTPLIQPDGLHPTAAGLVFIMQQAMAQLEERGLVKPSQWRRDPAAAMARLPDAARDALDTPSAGWLDKAGMYLAYRSLGDELEAPAVDCDAVVRSVERLFGPAPTLDADPSGTGLGGTMAILAAHAAVDQCPDAAVPLRRCTDRLGLDIRRPRPNAFRLELWSELSRMLGRQQEVDERVARLCRELGPDWGGYFQVIDETCVRLRVAQGVDRAEVAAARARVVKLLGGAAPTAAHGRWLLERTGDNAGTAPAPVTAMAPSTSGADRRQAPLPLPAIAFPQANDARASLWVRSERARRVLDFVLDLRAAAVVGEPGAAEAARDLLEATRARVGDDAIGAAIDRSSRLGECPLLPNGGVVVRGYVDPAQRLNWGPFGDDEPISFSVEGLVRPAPATNQPAGPSPMRQLIDRRPPIALGMPGRFGAPDGDFTFIDGESVLTRTGTPEATAEVTALASPDELVSRAVDGADPRDVSMRPLAADWSARPLGDVADLPALWAAVWRDAQRAGVDVAFPFGVRVDGLFDSITVRVERGAESASSAADAGSSLALLLGAPLPVPRPPAIVELGGVNASLVGVVAPWSICRVVRPGTPMRLHAVWTAPGGTRHTGEVVELRDGRGLSLRLPG